MSNAQWVWRKVARSHANEGWRITALGCRELCPPVIDTVYQSEESTWELYVTFMALCNVRMLQFSDKAGTALPWLCCSHCPTFNTPAIFIFQKWHFLRRDWGCSWGRGWWRWERDLEVRGVWAKKSVAWSVFCVVRNDLLMFVQIRSNLYQGLEEEEEEEEYGWTTCS